MSKYWNYTDAIAYALALHETEEPAKLAADPTRWHKALHDLRNEFRDSLPARVYRRVAFDERPGYPPYSAKIDHFLHVMAQTDLMSASNPAFKVLAFDADQKKRIVALNKDRLNEDKDVLAAFGKKLTEMLSVST